MNDKNIYYYYVNFLQNGVRGKTNITFNTSLGVIFGVKKYAERLLKVHCMYSNINYEFLIITFLDRQILDAFNFQLLSNRRKFNDGENNYSRNF